MVSEAMAFRAAVEPMFTRAMTTPKINETRIAFKGMGCRG